MILELCASAHQISLAARNVNFATTFSRFPLEHRSWAALSTAYYLDGWPFWVSDDGVGQLPHCFPVASSPESYVRTSSSLVGHQLLHWPVLSFSGLKYSYKSVGNFHCLLRWNAYTLKKNLRSSIGQDSDAESVLLFQFEVGKHQQPQATGPPIQSTRNPPGKPPPPGSPPPENPPLKVGSSSNYLWY